MLPRALPFVIVLSLGLGVADLAYLNLHLVPRLLDDRAARRAADAPDAVATAQPAPPRPQEKAPAPRAQARRAHAAVDERGRRAMPAPAGLEAESAEPAGAVAHFATNRATLSGESRRAVEAVATRLLVEPSLRISVDGHADHRGAEPHNEALARRRAERVADHLVAQGVERARITVRAFGAERPQVSGDDAGALRANRRVDLTLHEGEP
jgi:outer membrane protein OmpA-like peptidoglycan-associated protein